MEENQIIVDVGLDAFIQSLRHLQKQYELNTAALKAMKDAGEEQSDAYITLTQEQKVLRQLGQRVSNSVLSQWNILRSMNHANRHGKMEKYLLERQHASLTFHTKPF